MYHINSISEYLKLLSLPEPLHPLVSVADVSKTRLVESDVWKKFSLNFYCISLKKDIATKLKYGQRYYDFNKGTMTFLAPNQVQSLEFDEVKMINENCGTGYSLLFYSDFLQKHPLANIIKNYDFFSYAVNEALHLSEREEKNIIEIFQKIATEYQHIDQHTQDIILSQIDLLLNYCKRFYDRQFITRKAVNNDLLSQMEQILNDYFDSQEGLRNGLLTVDSVASKLNLSPHYLSDMLRSLTGQNAQHHIHEKLIEKAKQYLISSNLSVSEIAFQLGFEYPQSFNKLFKKKTAMSPLEFRHTFN
ncbi:MULTISPECIES: helix-turn-helix domain-containing protein [Sphingobacterium]|uniref:helix-turn-helix domain-containing protein n=1 Tax=Sphingobacterium TaxID=28453 RepID=UPI0013E4A379|nr:MULTISPECIES: response regulator transcription factor [Sphingobacterium]QIH34260.1 helix-turn-helix transcriptional regulator [Sphingobacterium sp. DR205]